MFVHVVYLWDAICWKNESISVIQSHDEIQPHPPERCAARSPRLGVAHWPTPAPHGAVCTAGSPGTVRRAQSVLLVLGAASGLQAHPSGEEGPFANEAFVSCPPLTSVFYK